LALAGGKSAQAAWRLIGEQMASIGRKRARAALLAGEEEIEL